MPDTATTPAAAPAGVPFLEVADLSRRFGGLWAVKDVSFTVTTGTIFALIGPNGAGKSTIVNLLSGADRPTEGRVTIGETDTTGWPPHLVSKKGLVRTFQNGRLFKRLTVLENVLVGAHCGFGANLLDVLTMHRGSRNEEARLTQRAMDLLAELGLEGEAHESVTNLPFGHQRKLEIARALVSEPTMLLLDEPAAGLNSGEVEELARYLDTLRGRGLGILLIEHNMGFVSKLADTITVLNFGEKIADGRPADVLKREVVIEAYLGRKRRYARM